MSEFSLSLLEVPFRPPGYDVAVGAHWPELLGMAVLLPGIIAVLFLVVGLGPHWLKTAREKKA